MSSRFHSHRSLPRGGATKVERRRGAESPEWKAGQSVPKCDPLFFCGQNKAVVIQFSLLEQAARRTLLQVARSPSLAWSDFAARRQIQLPAETAGAPPRAPLQGFKAPRPDHPYNSFIGSKQVSLKTFVRFYRALPMRKSGAGTANGCCAPLTRLLG